jgi:ATP-dependent Clp protease ATP-binding subunit ClpC
MNSHRLQRALETRIVGQRRAVDTIVRAMTVAMSHLGNPQGPLGAYLFLGPSGTGKTHMARSVAELLHGDRRRLVVADCVQMDTPDEWASLAMQLAPHFRPARADDDLLYMPRHSIVVVEHLEAARPTVVRALAGALESGHIMLPGGRRGSLRECLVLMTSTLCAREIYGADRQEIGFSTASAEQELTAAAERQWGAELLGHLDDLIVFHRLREHHLPFILRRLVEELNGQLEPHEVECRLEPLAVAFLQARAARFLQHGAWFLTKVFHRFVLFPVADLMSSGRVQPGRRIRVHFEGDERLRFEVEPRAGSARTSATAGHRSFRVPVEWETEAQGAAHGSDR